MIKQLFGGFKVNLSELQVGQTAKILSVDGEGALRRRFLEMGLTPNTSVTVQKIAPFGDPIQITLRGYELTLRIDDAKKIQVTK